MSPTLWQTEYTLGVVEIDREHQIIFDLVDTFENLQLNDSPIISMYAQLTNIITFVQLHFRHEETLMRRVGYPKLYEHQIEHDNLVDDIFVIHKRFGADPFSTFNLMLIFLQNLILHHMLTFDTPLTEFIKQK